MIHLSSESWKFDYFCVEKLLKKHILTWSKLTRPAAPLPALCFTPGCKPLSLRAFRRHISRHTVRRGNAMYIVALFRNKSRKRSLLLLCWVKVWGVEGWRELSWEEILNSGHIWVNGDERTEIRFLSFIEVRVQKFIISFRGCCLAPKALKSFWFCFHGNTKIWGPNLRGVYGTIWMRTDSETNKPTRVCTDVQTSALVKSKQINHQCCAKGPRFNLFLCTVADTLLIHDSAHLNTELRKFRNYNIKWSKIILYEQQILTNH